MEAHCRKYKFALELKYFFYQTETTRFVGHQKDCKGNWEYSAHKALGLDTRKKPIEHINQLSGIPVPSSSIEDITS